MKLHSDLNFTQKHSNFIHLKNSRNSFKNGKIRTVQVRPPFLAEIYADIFTNWSNIVRIELAHKKTTMGPISVQMDEIRSKSVTEIKLCVFDFDRL
jgi:hypothetical protein